MTVSEYICHYLACYDVRQIYGYPGAAILPLIDAIYTQPNLRWILMRHEYTAALAACAQAKLTGQLSVCLATSGPGALNLITGLLDAKLDRAPVLAITGLLPSTKLQLASFQDIDQGKLINSFCGYSAMCTNPAQIQQLLQNIIGYIIKNKSVGHITIPVDIQQAPINVQDIKAPQRAITLMAAPDEAVALLADTINSNLNTIIAVGPRARGAGQQIEALSEKICAPIICSFAGKGVVNENHANYFGVLGLYGAPANQIAMAAIKDAEMVIAIGIDDLSYFLTKDGIEQTRQLIQIEADISMVSDLFLQTRTLLGELPQTIAKLVQKLSSTCGPLLHHAKMRKDELIKADSKKIATKHDKVHPAIFFQKLNEYVDTQDTVITFDIGDNALWAMEYLALSHHQRTLVSNKLGVMGFGLSATIAAKLTCPNQKIVGIMGDGSIQMVLGELGTAKQENLNIYIIVINNGVLQRVSAQQNIAHGIYLLDPDFVSLGESYGAYSVRIQNDNEIDLILREAFQIKDNVVLIDVMCEDKIFAPMIGW